MDTLGLMKLIVQHFHKGLGRVIPALRQNEGAVLQAADVEAQIGVARYQGSKLCVEINYICIECLACMHLLLLNSLVDIWSSLNVKVRFKMAAELASIHGMKGMPQVKCLGLILRAVHIVLQDA